jgi:hypothetical protein
MFVIILTENPFVLQESVVESVETVRRPFEEAMKVYYMPT